MNRLDCLPIKHLRARRHTPPKHVFRCARIAVIGLACVGALHRQAFAAGGDPLVSFGQQAINTLLTIVGLLAVGGGLITGARLIFGASVGGSRVASDAILSAAAIIGGLAFALFAPQIVQNIVTALGANGFQLPQMPQVGGG
jgi:hypothetical protein